MVRVIYCLDGTDCLCQQVRSAAQKAWTAFVPMHPCKQIVFQAKVKRETMFSRFIWTSFTLALLQRLFLCCVVGVGHLHSLSLPLSLVVTMLKIQLLLHLIYVQHPTGWEMVFC